LAFESRLRTDILNEELKTPRPGVQVIAETQYVTIVSNSDKYEKDKTPFPSKDILEIMGLIKTVVEEYEEKKHLVEDARVLVTYENPDQRLEDLTQERSPKGILSISIRRRQPGAFGGGAPFEQKVKNRRPILREEIDDPENPGYRKATLGYFYDNVMRITCWARTNKVANELGLWFEGLMEDYLWWFRYSGVNRILFQDRGPDMVEDIKGIRLYGRPIDYFVRTERLTVVSQKKLEQILIRCQIAEQ